MLVLSRKPTETIRIDNNITISILSVKGNVVRVGIEAPTSVRIVRGELPPLAQYTATLVTQATSAQATPSLGEGGEDSESVSDDEVVTTSLRSGDPPLGSSQVGSLRARLKRRMLAMACQ